MTAHYHSIDLKSARENSPCVLAIGNFDGVHLGHQSLIHTTKALAKTNDYQAAVLTFAPHPREYFNPALKPLTLMRTATKIKALADLGVDKVIFAKFGHSMATMEAEAFIKDFCVDELNAHHIVTGDNFYFGRNRKGNVALLEKTMRELKLGYSCVEPVSCADGETISSSRVRAVLSGGNVSEAAKLLGRPFILEGRVGHGDKRGRELGFPTANIPMHNLYLPAFGVYAICADYKGTKINGVANLGIRPSFDGERPQLETHLFDWGDDLYGKRLSIELLHYIRPEKKFSSKQLLIDQIKQDVIKAKQLLS